MADISSETDCRSSRPMPPSLSTKRRNRWPFGSRLTSRSTSSYPRPAVTRSAILRIASLTPSPPSLFLPKKKSGASPLWCNTPSWNKHGNRALEQWQACGGSFRNAREAGGDVRVTRALVRRGLGIGTQGPRHLRLRPGVGRRAFRIPRGDDRGRCDPALRRSLGGEL